MRLQPGFSLLVRVALVATCALQAAGCNALSDFISGEKYRGPWPAEEDISNEVAIIRRADVTESGQTVLLIDRVRYTNAGDPHNVNRVVEVRSGAAMRDVVAALNPGVGDSVLISSQYQGYTNVIGIRSVPNWPGHTAYEYPIAIHALTAITRAGG